MHLFGAITFACLAVASAAFGVYTMVAVTQTMFGPAAYSTGVTVTQFLLSAVFIGAAYGLQRACRYCLKCHSEGSESTS